jgi:hypothetical protein
MRDEHFLALEKFWNNITGGSKVARGSIKVESVLVLPRNYGWGMRSPEDTIWGFWGPDEQSAQIWTLSRKLITQYGFSLDIVYDDPSFDVSQKYCQIYYWNVSQTN